MKKKELKAKGMKAAEMFLSRRGFEILEANWKCDAGESDIIARDGWTLVFLKVNARFGAGSGMDDVAVAEEERAVLENVASYYLQEFPETDIPVRFDRMSVVILNEGRAFIRHHINAFGIDYAPWEE